MSSARMMTMFGRLPSACAGRDFGAGAGFAVGVAVCAGADVENSAVTVAAMTVSGAIFIRSPFLLISCSVYQNSSASPRDFATL